MRLICLTRPGISRGDGAVALRAQGGAATGDGAGTGRRNRAPAFHFVSFRYIIRRGWGGKGEREPSPLAVGGAGIGRGGGGGRAGGAATREGTGGAERPVRDRVAVGDAGREPAQGEAAGP